MRAAILALAMLCLPVLEARPQRPAAALEAPRPGRLSGYFELLGAGGLYSLNVERITPSDRLFRLGFTNGAMANSDNVTNGERALIATAGRVFSISPPASRQPMPIEIGGGLVLGKQWRHQSGNNPDDGAYAAIVGALGIRGTPVGSGFLWRVTFTPFLNLSAHNDNTEKGFQPWGGFSAGWVF
ncbi:MAG TPA: hypothetical protein VFO55_02345 [Gemmatimonadaceae bacterium]|nr:hypothetical protein [Gemmatimonadaceae bacterium]